jgi:hypothetical protein
VLIHNYDRIGDRPATGLLTDSEYLEAARQHLTTKGKAAQNKVKDRNFGIYGAWVYLFLNYSDYRLHSQYGAMHCLSGICSLIMMHLSQSRSTKMSSLMKSYLRNCNMHPYCTREKEPHIHWLLKRDENRFDCIMASCIKPTGMHEEKKAPTSIYDKFGKLKCAEDINIFAYFLPYLVSTVGDHFSKAYKSFICMLSNNVREIIQRFIPAAEVGPLQNRYEITWTIFVLTVTSVLILLNMCIYVAISILQSLCVGEGLFPPNINTFIYHEMVHLVPMVEQFGPPREIWEFRGERLVRQIKDSAPNKGGLLLEISAVKMYMAMESEKTTTVYNEEAYGEADENLPAKESISLQCVSESRRIIFNKQELIELLTCIISSVPLSAEAIHDLKMLKITIECTHQDTVLAALGSRFCWLGYTKSVYLKATSNVATDINIKGRGIQFHRAYDSIKSNWWKSSQVNSWASRLKLAPKLL